MTATELDEDTNFSERRSRTLFVLHLSTRFPFDVVN